MHATIWCDAAIDGTYDWDAREGRALASRLSALPGFVAYVALAEETGGIAAICICEDAETLAAANDLIAAWRRGDDAGQEASRAAIRTGEVIVQKGL